MEAYLFTTVIVGVFLALARFGSMLIGALQNDTQCARVGLGLFLVGVAAPIAAPIVMIFCIIKAIKVADLPSLLPGPKEQSPGQLSITSKQRSEVRR